MKVYMHNKALSVAFLVLTVGLGTLSMQAAQQGTALHDAAKLGDLAWVRELLSTRDVGDAPV